MAIRVGDVIRVWDRHTRPPKFKRHICICPQKQLFLRINSRALFPPHMIIRSDGADFLDADSYVELQQLVRHYALEITEADVLGRLTRTHVTALIVSVKACSALSQEMKDLILERLSQY
ncbi:hypothetical protein L598_000700001120 [Mesorhizobium sp. J18]|uniref:hypothetical protein n=1 Tax=Mesorhizobium sp. J18 TaxID=935263 RepID=UPI00119BF599|nr:hypothetical protein [Mesorhizobium sp. J18]TWG90355.1 hypothetical protein L598_000700001120 [Mesorhizobium sp. J18]